jgi:formate--tetrahydrofolate ligase
MDIPPDDVISREAKLLPMEKIVESAGLLPNEYEIYGKGVAKLFLDPIFSRIGKQKKRAKFVAVTAMTPYSLGLGKSVTTVSLVQGLHHLGKSVIGGFRQPNLAVGLAGIKGGAAGGGYSQIIPMQRFNTGLTGDEDRITNANNLAMALINGLIINGVKTNTLQFDPKKLWFDAYAINAPDQGFREFLMSPAGNVNAGELYRRQGYITVATEIQGIMAMSKNYDDLLERLGNVIIAPKKDSAQKGKEFLRFKDVYHHGIHHMLAGYLEDGLRPNLMQTLNGAPFLVHMGPFANISTGNNSVVADKIGLKLAKDVYVTECGFGSECGFYKLWHVVGSSLGETPDVAVIVYTLPGLKFHGGVIDIRNKLRNANPEAVGKGVGNLLFHISHCKKYGISVIAVHNKRPDDQPEDLKRLKEVLELFDVEYAGHEGFAKGGEGATELAELVLKAKVDSEKKINSIYGAKMPLKDKIEAYVEYMDGDPSKITYSKEAEEMVEIIDSSEEFIKLPLCPAKTQSSQTGNTVDENNPDTYKWVGRHKGFAVHINEIRLFAGAGYVVPVIGSMRLLPGVTVNRSVVNDIYFNTKLPEGVRMEGLG